MQEHEIDSIIIDRVELDRLPQPRYQSERPLHIGQQSVRMATPHPMLVDLST
jgi:hypothetical protein